MNNEDKLCDEIHDLVKNKNPEILALRKQFSKKTGIFVIECNYSAYADWLELKQLSILQPETELCQCSEVDCEKYSWSNLCYYCRKPLRTETIHSRYSPPEPEGEDDLRFVLNGIESLINSKHNRATIIDLKTLWSNLSDAITENDNKLSNIKKELKEKTDKINELGDRLSECRDYLMQIEPSNISIEDTLEALGYGRNGLKFD